MSEVPPNTDSADVKFYYMVIGLLIVVAFALAGLWIIERGNRIKSENQAQNIIQQAQKEQSQIQMAVQGLMGQAWIDRSSLPTQEITLRGQQVFLLGAEKAQRLGFQPGDMFLVSQPPQTQPSETQPSK